MQDSTSQYWEEVWDKRLVPGGMVCNTAKADILVDKLRNRSEILPLKKLEVGCGGCFHILSLAEIDSEWKRNYVGIDLAENAIVSARDNGLECEVASVYDYESPGYKIECFIFFDVLEHIENHQKVIDAINRLKAPRFRVIGNVPLYRSKLEKNDGFERDVDISDIIRLFRSIGATRFYHEVYGINGYPYMFFDGGFKI